MIQSLLLACPRGTAIVVNVLLSFLAFWLTVKLIPSFMPLFIKRNMYGLDLNKREKEKKPVPEAQGMICGASYLIAMFLFIPFPFIEYWVGPTVQQSVFAHNQFSEYLCALLSICCMIFLGFADDVLDLRWRDKLVLPTIASLPLLMVYTVNSGSTTIVTPTPLRGMLPNTINLGVFYYVYMGMLAVFCTNAINILAGINGVESGQSVVIAVSLAINSIIQVLFVDCCVENHLFALYLIMPFIGVSTGLFIYNRYPSRVFVGDTFCYFAGMTFAVVGILGHFSKTMLLFFIPQIINTVYSFPQLFRVIPCPRHRLPKFDEATGLVGMSWVEFKPDSLGTVGRFVFRVLSTLRLVVVRPSGKDDGSVEMNNLTIINVALRLLGPINEGALTTRILLFQIGCSVFALFCRYVLVQFLFY